MAKIDNLEIKTINIAVDAATGYDEGTTTVTAVNEAGGPVCIRASADVSYATGGGGGTGATYQVVVTRNSDSKEIARGQVSFSGYTPQTKAIGAAGVDMTAGNDEAYTAVFSQISGAGAASSTNKRLAAGWDTKH